MKKIKKRDAYFIDGKKIRRLRLINNISRAAVYKVAMVALATQSKVESGKQKNGLTFSQGLKLAEILGVDPYELVIEVGNEIK